MTEKPKHDGCPTCMTKKWESAPDGHGGEIVSYLCTSEYRYCASGEVRVIKPCPDAKTIFDETQYRKS